MSKILLVDDSSDLLNVFPWILKKRGYDCVTTYYKDGLFYQLTKFTPSIIIIDVKLDAEDGRELCRSIKEDPVTKNIPVIICSGDPYLLENFKECLADDFLEKPLQINDVIIKLDNLLKNKAHPIA